MEPERGAEGDGETPGFSASGGSTPGEPGGATGGASPSSGGVPASAGGTRATGGVPVPTGGSTYATGGSGLGGAGGAPTRREPTTFCAPRTGLQACAACVGKAEQVTCAKEWKALEQGCRSSLLCASEYCLCEGGATAECGASLCSCIAGCTAPSDEGSCVPMWDALLACLASACKDVC